MKSRVIICLLSLFKIAIAELPCNEIPSSSTATDPRSTYHVDLTKYAKNQSINGNDIVKEIIEGQGFQILHGLFEPEEVQHAREVILYLIAKQGAKATHFQVCNVLK